MKSDGRGDRIRTCDPLVPNQMRYRTAPLPGEEIIVSGKHFIRKSVICLRKSENLIRRKTLLSVSDQYSVLKLSGKTFIPC